MGQIMSDDKILLPEIVEDSGEVAKPLRRKKLSPINMRIAEMAARGFSPEQIAHDVGRTRARVYEILKTDEVWEEVKDRIRDTFSEGDRVLAYLYKKAMLGLDTDLSSTDPEIRKAARADIFRQWGYGRDKGGEGERTSISLFQQIFTGRAGTSTGSVVQSIDDLILQKRKDRGLPAYPPEDEDDKEDGSI
jgi:hypothetical protein